MEKYEINKFIDEYGIKLNDLNEAFNIDGLKNELVGLDSEINNPDFWSDQNKAQSTIQRANEIKEILSQYSDLKKSLLS